MANTRNSNTFYIDTQYSAAADELAIPNLSVAYIILTSSANPGVLTLADSAGATKITVKTATANESKVIDLRQYPISFPSGIRPTTLTSAIATLVIIDSRG